MKDDININEIINPITEDKLPIIKYYPYETPVLITNDDTTKLPPIHAFKRYNISDYATVIGKITIVNPIEEGTKNE